jgi:NAD(P)-dependent dehydrogenase (short-subunit alcohol dehydrogenase family)
MRDQVVLITGGSAGFGAELSQAWGRVGAKLAICGREPNRVQQSVELLRRGGTDAEGYAVDVTQEANVAELFDRVRQRFQRLDVLVNNVGRSTRGRAAETSPEAFRELLEINFLSAVRCTQHALPLLLETRGHIVFMGSLASKAAAPFLGAYPPSKFALAGYAHQLRLELAEDGIHVLLVCPGPIAREDAGHRYDQQAEDLPASARQPGGGVKLSGIPPRDLAERIVLACQRREAEIVWPRSARWLFAISQLSPRLGDWIIRRKMK